MSYQISWSLNEEKLYLYDDVEQYNVVEIKFADYKTKTKEQKLAAATALLLAENFSNKKEIKV
jgi:hypothetical protein